MKVSHGNCTRCNHEISCPENIRCSEHTWWSHHYDPLECIENMKRVIDKLNKDIRSRKDEIRDLLRQVNVHQ